MGVHEFVDTYARNATWLAFGKLMYTMKHEVKSEKSFYGLSRVSATIKDFDQHYKLLMILFLLWLRMLSLPVPTVSAAEKVFYTSVAARIALTCTVATK